MFIFESSPDPSTYYRNEMFGSLEKMPNGISLQGKRLLLIRHNMNQDLN